MHLLVTVPNNKQMHGTCIKVITVITVRVKSAHTVCGAEGRKSFFVLNLCERFLILRNKWVRRVARVEGGRGEK